jgi:hypothetical protein
MSAKISHEPIRQLVVPWIELGQVSDNASPDRPVGALLSWLIIVQIERVLQCGDGPIKTVLPLLQRWRIGSGAGVAGMRLGRGPRRRSRGGGGGGGGVAGRREGLRSVVSLHQDLL